MSDTTTAPGTTGQTTDAPTHLMVTDDLTASVMSSFVRSDDGSVKVETESVNLKLSSMLNTGGGGILQKELGGVGDIGGFRRPGGKIPAHAATLRSARRRVTVAKASTRPSACGSERAGLTSTMLWKGVSR